MSRFVSLAVAVAVALIAQAASAAENTYIIGFRGKPGFTEHQKVEGRKGKIRRSMKALPVIVADLSETEAEALRQDPDVAYVEQSVSFVVAATPSTASPEYGTAWGVQRIGADALHAAGITGAGVKVGIIDSGIDLTHPDLMPNYREGYDFVFKDDFPNDETSDSHGTHVAGIIAAKGNGSGVIGVAPDAELYIMRVLDGSGSGTTDWVVSAVDWAITKSVNILNVSGGFPYNFLSIQDAFKRAADAGIIVVAAAGNGSQATPGKEIYSYPALYDSVIAVSATDRSDAIASWSNYGAKIELAAPGVDITSTIVGGGVGVLSGTSMAAPHVAGAAALLLSSGTIVDTNADGSLIQEVRDALAAKAIDLGASGRDPYYGFGLLNLSDAPKPVVVSVSGGSCLPVSQKVATGSYSIEISNHGLEKLTVFRPGIRDRKWPATIRFTGTRPQTVTLDVTVTLAEETLFLMADGKKGTSATITIRKK